MRKVYAKSPLLLSRSQANCQQPRPLPALANGFSHCLLFAGLRFQERALFLISGRCVALGTMGPSASEKSCNSLPQHHSFRICGDSRSRLSLCFLRQVSCCMYIFLLYEDSQIKFMTSYGTTNL